MDNSLTLKNELIFEYAAGTLSIPKSLMAATYLFLNSNEKTTFNEFENYCAHEFKQSNLIKPQKITAENCITKQEKKDGDIKQSIISPLS